MKYQKLKGLCKNCLYKCARCEDPNFKGTKNCEYYIKNIENKKKV